MSEFEPFDDELLSAYLDDELAPEERARVEARLASDPAARQLLDELRAVSQSVQGLPRESLPNDLTETVLRRAERAMLTPASTSASDSDAAGRESTIVELLRKIPIGRSRRAWLWAGTAIAAGLLIMIFEKEPQDADVPREVALHRAPVDHPLSPLELRAVDKPAAAPLVADTSGVEPSAPPPEVVAARRPRAVEDLSRASTVESRPESGTETDRFAGGEGSFGIAGDEIAQRESAEEAPSAPADDVNLLVVTVSAKPEAIERKLIDAVLARNGIVVEDSAEARAGALMESRDRSELAAEPSRGPQTFGSRWSESESLSDGSGGDGSPMDVVLVEARPAQIVGCLSALDADHSNYLGIEVDDQLAETKSAIESGYDWKQHSRGIVPTKQKVQVAPNNNLYLEADGRQIEFDADSAGSRRSKKSLADVDTATAPAAEHDARDGSLAQGRALRVQQQNLEPSNAPQGEAIANSSSAEQSAVPPAAGYDAARAYDTQSWGYARRGMQKLTTKAETLQMLILLCPTEEPAEPASSPAPANSVP